MFQNHRELTYIWKFKSHVTCGYLVSVSGSKTFFSSNPFASGMTYLETIVFQKILSTLFFDFITLFLFSEPNFFNVRSMSHFFWKKITLKKKHFSVYSFLKDSRACAWDDRWTAMRRSWKPWRRGPERSVNTNCCVYSRARYPSVILNTIHPKCSFYPNVFANNSPFWARFGERIFPTLKCWYWMTGSKLRVKKGQSLKVQILALFTDNDSWPHTWFGLHPRVDRACEPPEREQPNILHDHE